MIRSARAGAILVAGPVAPDTDWALENMNQPQQEAVARAFEILSEHFDHVVLAVGAYHEDRQYTTAASFTGGVAAALGLCQLYATKWTREHLWGGPGAEEEKDV